MARYFIVGGAVLLVCGMACVGYQAITFEPKIVPGAQVGNVRVGGLSRDEAARQVRVWWESERVRKIQLTNPLIPTGLPSMDASALGVVVDDTASVADLPLENYGQSVLDKVKKSSSEDPPSQAIIFKTVRVDYSSLSRLVRQLSPAPKPASVRFEGGSIVTKKESTSYRLDTARLAQAAMQAVEKGAKELEIPIEEAPKHVPDAALNDIQDVVSSYTTEFSSSNVPRSTNIRLASRKLNGIVLMPGDVVSFNQTVGERTVEGGYQVAGVLKDGKHDTGLGGGICQVSGTLYNALILADLKIVHRENHSIPVPYIAVGRDATVDYGDLDLVFKNNTDKAIAVCSDWSPGSLTFRILGTKDANRTVRIETDHYRTWDNGEETRVDPTLPPGAKNIDNPGAMGRSIDTYRLVYESGKLVSRELLSHSYYSGAKRVVIVGPPKTVQTAAPTTDETPPLPSDDGSAPQG
jgi:vancomycin resistance protein YoaR